MKKLTILLAIASLSLAGCQQTAKKTPDFSVVTKELVTVDEKNSDEATLLSSSSKKKSSSSSKSSMKKSEEKKQSNQTETAIVTESAQTSSKNTVSKNLFGVDWDSLTDEEKQFINWLVVSSLGEEFENGGRFQSWYEQGFTVDDVIRKTQANGLPQELLPIIEGIGDRYNNYSNIRSTEEKNAEEERRLEEWIEQYQWERDNLDDPLLEYRQGSIVEDDEDDFDWSFQDWSSGDSTDWGEINTGQDSPVTGIGWAYTTGSSEE